MKRREARNLTTLSNEILSPLERRDAEIREKSCGLTNGVSIDHTRFWSLTGRQTATTFPVWSNESAEGGFGQSRCTRLLQAQM